MRIFLHIPLPSAIASDIAEKLLFVSITEDALLAASEAVSTVHPTSAALRDAVSFIPSPIIETVSPHFWKAFTILVLSTGDTRANTV